MGDQPGQVCTSAFFVAMCEFGQGNRAAGREALRTCLDSGVFTYVYYRLGQVLLERAETDEDWPSWVEADR